MKETDKLKAAYLLKESKVDLKPILKMLGVGAGAGGVGYGTGHVIGKNKGYEEGAQVGTDSAMRNLIMGLYKTLTETASKGQGVSIPGLELGDKVKHIAPKNPVNSAVPKAPAVDAAAAPPKAASYHMDILVKSAGLGSFVGKQMAKGLGKVLTRKGINVGPQTADFLMNPNMHSAVGRATLGAGALGGSLMTGSAMGGYGIGKDRGYGQGHEQGVGQGWEAGFGAGGNTALQHAGQAMNQTYGGFGGRFNALVGGAQPGQQAISQLMQQYQMPQQGWNAR